MVAKGHAQVKGFNFGEVFSLVAILTSIRILMSLAMTFDLEIEKMDMETTFLHGDLEEKKYVKKLKVLLKGKEELVYRLKKSLYGLNNSPRMWYQNFDTCIFSLVFLRSKVDHCVYSKKEGVHFIYGALYVDDMLLVRNDMDAIKEVKMQLSSKFNMKDIGVG